MAILVNGVKVAGVGVPGTNGKDATINGVNALTVEGLDPIVAQMVGSVLQISISGDIGGAKIESGSYVGTGKSGSSNPNSLVFGFTPKFVLIGAIAQSGVSSNAYITTYAFGARGWSQSNFVKLSVSGNSMTWSYTGGGENPSYQFDVSGVKYQYMALA